MGPSGRTHQGGHKLDVLQSQGKAVWSCAFHTKTMVVKFTAADRPAVQKASWPCALLVPVKNTGTGMPSKGQNTALPDFKPHNTTCVNSIQDHAVLKLDHIFKSLLLPNDYKDQIKDLDSFKNTNQKTH